MPARTDLTTILVLGSGPIVIGQAGEFDYSGTQACQALRSEGYRVVLINSNPATIMTDPGVADRTYVEPLDVETATAVIERERPDALLPTLGGQTALNLAMSLHEQGVLARYNVELIGANATAIRTAEDRQAFSDAMRGAGIPVLSARTVESTVEARSAAVELGLPLILRPAFTLGGEGGGVVASIDQLDAALSAALDASPIGQVLVERSVIGWGEFELEVIRDRADNAIVVCAIENLDPMGVHTGDSVTVAPTMTLTDGELQRMRDLALRVIRVVGVETGGSNVQFALNRDTGEIAVIEMNPRVSRSSALASKASGFPIARVAARLAVGYTLDELPNEITGVTPASFEPALDYVAVKMPRFAFEKMPEASGELTTAMQSVGEVLALGRTFAEAFTAAMSGRELDTAPAEPKSVADALDRLATTRWDRWDVMWWAARHGVDAETLSRVTKVHGWFCSEITDLAAALAALPTTIEEFDAGTLRDARRRGLTDQMIGAACGSTELEVGRARRRGGVTPAYRAVDTCAGEFAALTPYFYRTFESVDEPLSSPGDPVVILGSGPNRIGQGVEFDYCCVQAALALKRLGHPAIMVNCNPETVSTDHGVSDRLYLEPVTVDAVLDICARERPLGVITQLGGQTPLRLARTLAEEGIPLLGTSPAAIDLAEDRERFADLLAELGQLAPPWAVAQTPAETRDAAEAVGYPVLLRPSFVLGGRAMTIAYGPSDVADYLERERPRWPLLIDRFLEDAIELDVDALSDGVDCYVAAILEHVEAAGVHSGDSACVTPPQEAGPGIVDQIERDTAALAARLGAVGLVNVQFALQGDELYVIEANPRASRTVPFVAKATGVPLVEHAVRLMLGEPLRALDIEPRGVPRHVAVKEAVLPFARFPAVDPLLGPEMRATGEVMGIGRSFGEAFAKAQRGAGGRLPATGDVVISAGAMDKPRAVAVGQRLARLGFGLVATSGTAAALAAAGLAVTSVSKLGESGVTIPDLINDGRIVLAINTPSGRQAQSDGAAIRRAAVRAGIPYVTTMEAAEATADALRSSRQGPLALQDVLPAEVARSTSS